MPAEGVTDHAGASSGTTPSCCVIPRAAIKPNNFLSANATTEVARGTSPKSTVTRQAPIADKEDMGDWPADNPAATLGLLFLALAFFAWLLIRFLGQ